METVIKLRYSVTAMCRSWDRIFDSLHVFLFARHGLQLRYHALSCPVDRFSTWEQSKIWRASFHLCIPSTFTLVR